MESPTQIRFGEGLPTLLDYDNMFWCTGMTKTVEFFPNKFFTVKMVTSDNKNLEKYLNELDEDCNIYPDDQETSKYGGKIAIDLEWEVEINLFQFCSPKGRVLIIRHPDGMGNRSIFNFLISHKFYGKGTDSDVKQLKKKFSYLIKDDDLKLESNKKTNPRPNVKGNKKSKTKKKKSNKKDKDADDSDVNNNDNDDSPNTDLNDTENKTGNCEVIVSTKISVNFNDIIEDIAKTRLAPYGYSENFVKMTKEFAGESCAEFKDSEMTMSNWAAEKLTIRQVLYAAFDVVAIFACYPNFKPPLNMNQIIKSKNSNKNRAKQNKERKKAINKAKIIVLRNPIKKIYPAIIYGYCGPTNLIDLRLILQDNNSEDDIDFAYPYVFNEILYIFTAFTKEISEADIIKRLRGYADSAKLLSSIDKEIIDDVDPSDITDRDFLYVTNVPNKLFEKFFFSRFLFCFGTNFDFKLISSDETNDDELKPNQGYVQIEPRDASTCYRMRLFIPYLFNMKVDIFPTFLPKIRVDNIPNEYSNSELQKIFPNSIKIDFLRWPNKQSKKTSFIEFKTVEEAEEAIQNKNYLTLITNKETVELRVARYTDEAHLKFLKLFELSVHNCKQHGLDSSRSLRNYFQKYGKIYQAYYDERFEIGHVQFYLRRDAFNAIEEENKNSKNFIEHNFEKEKEENSSHDLVQPLFCETVNEDRIFVIRDVSFEVDDKEIFDLCSPYGEIQDIQTRDLTSYMRYSIKEITYSTHESAYQARLSLFSYTIKGNTVRVAVLNGGNIESTSWKNNQKKQWVIFRNIIFSKKKKIESTKAKNLSLKKNRRRIKKAENDSNENDTNNSSQASSDSNDNNNNNNDSTSSLIAVSNNKDENSSSNLTRLTSNEINNTQTSSDLNETKNANNNVSNQISSDLNDNRNTSTNESSLISSDNNYSQISSDLNNAKNTSTNESSQISSDYSESDFFNGSENSDLNETNTNALSIEQLHKECRKYGEVVRYEVSIENQSDVCVMFSKFEYVDEIKQFIKDDPVLSKFKMESPNNEEFVSVLNPNELGLVFITPAEKEKIKNEMEKLKEVVGSEEESTLVILFKSLHSRPDAIDIYNAPDLNSKVILPKKPNDPLEAVSILTKEKIDDFLTEFSGMYDVYLNEQEDRAIIFAQSKAIIKKIFKNFWQEGRFNPIRVKYKDLENPPPISSICSSNINMNEINNNKAISDNLNLILNDNNSNSNNLTESNNTDENLISIEGFSGNEKIIVVDPIPDEMNEEIIDKICYESKGKFETRITRSAKEVGKRRALLFGKNHATRNKLLREMSGAFKGHPMKSVAMHINEIPPSLPI